MSLARGEGGGVHPCASISPESQSELIPERSCYGLISSMTSFIPFLVGSTVASILVLAVVVAIVIARSGGSDVAIPHWPSRATFTPAEPELPPLLEREAVIRAYASCGGRYSGDASGSR